MCSASRLVLVVAALAGCGSASGAADRPPLRVCADPNNLPFSNRDEQGFENALAKLVAADLGRSLEYTWQPQRRGFIRNTLKAKKCDVVLGVPVGYEMTETTRPYYRSSYVFVTRRARSLAPHTLDDRALRGLRIGLHAIGDDYSNVPPAQALARRGLQDRIVGYSIYGDYAQPDPPAELLHAVERGDIDVAIAWGPLAGYFAQRSRRVLQVWPLTGDDPGMTFAIAMGVRHGDDELKRQLDGVIERRHDDIARLLARYGVPQLPIQEDKP
jgi:mxaJ protein